MKAFKTVSSEIVGLFFLLISATATIAFPGVGDFWLALGTVIVLFLTIYARLHFGDAAPSHEAATR
jgi:hypothetical protein